MKIVGDVAHDRKPGSTKVIIDSGAMRSVVNNVDLLSLGSYKLLPKGAARICGIVGDNDLSMTGEGNLLAPFGSIRAFRHAQVTANILSFRDLLQIYFDRIVDQNLPTESLLCINRTNTFVIYSTRPSHRLLCLRLQSTPCGEQSQPSPKFNFNRRASARRSVKWYPSQKPREN